MWGLGVLIPLLGAVGALQVSQEPGEVQVTAGDEVALGCRLLVAEPWDLLRLEWVTDTAHRVLCATRLRPATPVPSSPCAPRLCLAWDPPCATLSVLQARGDDAGRYLCRVTLEIPRLGSATGNGTLLNVTAAADGRHHTGLIWGLVGGLGGTALLVGLVLLSYRCWRRDPETSIYMNTLPSLAGVPKKLPPPHTVMENNTYQGGLHGAWGSPSTPWP